MARTNPDRHTHAQRTCTEWKLNLKELIQEQRLHSETETWAILRSFGYSLEVVTIMSRLPQAGSKKIVVCFLAL